MEGAAGGGGGEPPEASPGPSGSAGRRDDNPFSFRHFLKRDLSLPTTNTYERTGARPKTYQRNASPPSPSILQGDVRRHARPSNGDVCEVSAEAHRSLYSESDVPLYHRPNLASEPLGMPSLPDFVQDHILVEQAYLNTDGHIDLDNLPDFTFNTDFNQPRQAQCSDARRNISLDGGRDYDYETDAGPGGRSVPVARVPPVLPLDLPPHLSLDLTESVNPGNRRNPLDLPPNTGTPNNSSNESMRLPDFLPTHTGRATPERSPGDEPDLQTLQSELNNARSELYSERSRTQRLESELASARSAQDTLRAELRESRAGESALRQRLQEASCADHGYTSTLATGVEQVESNLQNTATRATEAESAIAKLKSQIKKLKEELSLSQAEAASLRARQNAASGNLRHATDQAEHSLRELLAGLGRLRTISDTLDPP